MLLTKWTSILGHPRLETWTNKMGWREYKAWSDTVFNLHTVPEKEVNSMMAHESNLYPLLNKLQNRTPIVITSQIENFSLPCKFKNKDIFRYDTNTEIQN